MMNKRNGDLNEVLYRGRREAIGICDVVVMDTDVDGHKLDPRFDLVNHSPTGFEWGYGGSGPAQLSLAILADYLGDDQMALDLYQDFKWDIVAQLPDVWKLTRKYIEDEISYLKWRRKGEF